MRLRAVLCGPAGDIRQECMEDRGSMPPTTSLQVSHRETVGKHPNLPLRMRVFPGPGAASSTEPASA